MQVVLEKSVSRLQFGIIVVLVGNPFHEANFRLGLLNQLASAFAKARKADWVILIFDEQQ